MTAAFGPHSVYSEHSELVMLTNTDFKQDSSRNVIYKQLHLVKIMIRRFGRETLSTYCQTLNGCAMPTDSSNSGRANAFFYLWTFFGKQNM
jgi:hypothetical protein